MDRGLRPLWSVLLPLSMRVINKTYKPSINAVPHRLIHWAPTDMDRGLFSPFREDVEIPPLKTEYVQQLEEAYERLLDVTSEHILLHAPYDRMCAYNALMYNASWRSELISECTSIYQICPNVAVQR